MAPPPSNQRPRRSLKLLAWPAFPLVALIAWVQVTGTALDILLVAAACFLVVAVERSVGDWLGELIGPAPTVILFATAIACGAWYVLGTDSGRSRSDQFLDAAEERGYRTSFVHRARPAETAPSGHSDAAAVESGRTVAGPAVRSGLGSTAQEVDQPRSGDRQPGTGTVDPSTSTAQSNRRTVTSNWSLFSRQKETPLATTIVLTLAPARVAVAGRTTVHAEVSAGGHPVTEGVVEFTVNGMSIGRVSLDAYGTARATYSTQISGAHQVHARFPGTRKFAASASGFKVLSVGR